eukprot:TRINITY_DN9212_c0_g1_i1.p1 TRINITY_DN9212_c0_g1~~TRINITY_DN9212_c0_g1_i1.p1  ORF type:complete len:764 (+),score=180.90 TRINITY_DN9212_c0_g1_i1:420-2711(+)
MGTLSGRFMANVQLYLPPDSPTSREPSGVLRHVDKHKVTAIYTTKSRAGEMHASVAGTTQFVPGARRGCGGMQSSQRGLVFETAHASSATWHDRIGGARQPLSTVTAMSLGDGTTSPDDDDDAGDDRDATSSSPPSSSPSSPQSSYPSWCLESSHHSSRHVAERDWRVVRAQLIAYESAEERIRRGDASWLDEDQRKGKGGQEWERGRGVSESELARFGKEVAKAMQVRKGERSTTAPVKTDKPDFDGGRGMEEGEEKEAVELEDIGEEATANEMSTNPGSEDGERREDEFMGGQRTARRWLEQKAERRREMDWFEEEDLETTAYPFAYRYQLVEEQEERIVVVGEEEDEEEESREGFGEEGGRWGRSEREDEEVEEDDGYADENDETEEEDEEENEDEEEEEEEEEEDEDEEKRRDEFAGESARGERGYEEEGDEEREVVDDEDGDKFGEEVDDVRDGELEEEEYKEEDEWNSGYPPFNRHAHDDETAALSFDLTRAFNTEFEGSRSPPSDKDSYFYSREFGTSMNEDGGAEIVDEDRPTRSALASAKFMESLGPRWAHPLPFLEQGCVLVATELLDGYSLFERSLILILSTEAKDGPYGLVLNKPLPHRVGKTRGMPPGLTTKFGRSKAFVGGPIGTQRFLLLHGHENLVGFEEVVPGAYYGGAQGMEAVEAIMDRNVEAGDGMEHGVAEAEDFRFFFGYAGWDFEQLKREIGLGWWHVAACSKEMLLEDGEGDLWEEVLSKMEGTYADYHRKGEQDTDDG